MTKIRHKGDSTMIEDRRGQSSGGGGLGGLGGMLGGGGGGGGMGFPLPGKMGGGLLGLLVMAAVLILPRLLGGSGATSGSTDQVTSPNLQEETTSGSEGGECDTQTAQIVCGAVEDVQLFWQREFETAGRSYVVTPTVFFSGGTSTGCGEAQSATGPFYCPADSKVYFDLDFLVQLQNQLDAPGDLASQYIVAHEYGHHLQNLLGISDQVRQLEQQNPSQANAYSVRLELQADCLAGVWAHDAEARGLLEPGEIDEALNAAAAVGDDRIQEQSGGGVHPESFTHGTSEQRQTWFSRGFTTGTSDQCDTFAE
ncbi:MAG: neutral zinc metallopeptidase [Acidimicrobiia bacterium]